MSDKTLFDALAGLAAIIAAHGVYALTVIFIFRQQGRAVADLSRARKEDRLHFSRVHTSVVIATYVLVLASSTVWAYATFRYHPRTFIRGVMTNLVDNHFSPKTLTDKPGLRQQIIADMDADVYLKTAVGDPDAGTYDLSWVLLPTSPPQTLYFRFQHHYAIARQRDPAASLTPYPEAVFVESNIIPKRFRLDLKQCGYTEGGSLRLDYVAPHDQGPDTARTIGHFVVQTASGPRPIPWDEETPTRTEVGPTARLLSFLPVAYAWSGKAPFKANGDYDADSGRALRARLGSTDLSVQLEARRSIINGGSRTFKFMNDALDDKAATSYDRSLLVANLAQALIEIGAQGTIIPAKLSVKLARASYDAQDFATALMFFDRSGPLEDENVFYRGVAHYKLGHMERAIADLQLYLATPHVPYASGVANTALALALDKNGERDRAIAAYQEAIRQNPRFAPAANNLAYLYAENGERLGEALGLADRAIELNRDRVEYRDTKGWILHLLNRNAEALPILQAAVTDAPDDVAIRGHFLEVQKAMGNPRPALAARPPK